MQSRAEAVKARHFNLRWDSKLLWRSVTTKLSEGIAQLIENGGSIFHGYLFVIR